MQVQQDRFDEHLTQMLQKLQECQDSRGLKGCFNCNLFFECNLRADYVKVVYNSMSKGDTGGFEF